MKEERTVWVEGKPYIVVLSDEREALLAAQAAGRAVVGIGEELPCRYLAESAEAADRSYLERIVRRHLGIPWRIAETERLLIREFQVSDAEQVPHEDGDRRDDQIFYTPELLSDYIRCQYGFYEYGIWALVDRATGRLVGKAGLTPGADGMELMEMAGCGGGEEDALELGYHIFRPYRGNGYAREACRGILNAAAEAWRRETEDEPLSGSRRYIIVYARTDASNEASVRVLRSCGFRLAGQYAGAAGNPICLYVLRMG